eukprot:10358711-Lingulodinium_polyedra.AAC.1
MATWQICEHGILSRALYHNEYTTPRGEKTPPFISEISTTASVAGNTPAPNDAEHPEARIVLRGNLPFTR